MCVALPYHFNLGLATLFDNERDRLLQTSSWFSDLKEGLVRALGRVTLSGGQDDFECVGSAQSHILGQWLL